MTKPGTPEADGLVPGARHAVAPAGIVSTGWPRVKATCHNIGWRFDPWQDAVGRLILAKAAGGKWAADLSLLSIPRQVGKSYLLGCIIFALCLLNPKLRVIWTSHHTATTEEMFEAMKELAKEKRVAPHIVKCIALQGSRWRIVFRNGSRIDFGARSRGFGRGKAKVGVLVLDEFQHITGRALANLAPTTNTADNPLILCAGTPPGPEVSGEAFILRRRAALEGLSDDTAYVEFSADPDADPADRGQWSKANPSFPKRTPERAFMLMRKMLDTDDFRREALGIWSDDDDHLLVMPNWSACSTDREPPEATHLAVAHDADRVWISVAAAASGPVPYVSPVTSKATGEVLHVRAANGRRTALAEVARICRERGIPVVVDAKDAPLIEDLEALDDAPTVIPASIDDFVQGCADLYDAVEANELEHGNHPELNRAVAAAGWSRGERRKWAPLRGEVSMLKAVTLAHWGAVNAPAYDLMDSFG